MAPTDEMTTDTAAVAMTGTVVAMTDMVAVAMTVAMTDTVAETIDTGIEVSRRTNA